METPETHEPRSIAKALAELAAAHGWTIPTPEERAQQLRDRQALGPEYVDCHCFGEGGSGDQLGMALERDTDGSVLVMAHIDGKPAMVWERICSCPDGVRYAQEIPFRRALAVEQLRQKRVSKLLGAAGISKLATRDGWNVEGWCRSAALAGAPAATVAEVRTKIAAWRAEIAHDGTCLLLLVGGSWGAGKSGLAEALVAECVTELRGALYRKAPEIANDLRLAYDRSGRYQADDPSTGSGQAAPGWDQLMRAYRDADLLALDDLGTEAMTGVYEDRIREWLITIIDGRMGDLRPTIVTTNRTRAEIAARYGERLADRFDSKYAFRIWLDTPNLRASGGQA